MVAFACLTSRHSRTCAGPDRVWKPVPPSRRTLGIAATQLHRADDAGVDRCGAVVRFSPRSRVRFTTGVTPARDPQERGRRRLPPASRRKLRNHDRIGPVAPARSIVACAHPEFPTGSATRTAGQGSSPAPAQTRLRFACTLPSLALTSSTAVGALGHRRCVPRPPALRGPCAGNSGTERGGYPEFPELAAKCRLFLNFRQKCAAGSGRAADSGRIGE